MEEIRLSTENTMNMLQTTLHDPSHSMQWWEGQREGRHNQLYREVQKEHGWVYRQFLEMKTPGESNHANLVGKLDMFTHELKRVWNVQHINVQ